jgi:hypothetical protein
MRGRRVALGILALALVAGSAVAGDKPDARFIIQCERSHVLMDDPIVLPSQPGASHSHDFFGSTTTHAASTYATMSDSATTCDFSADTAGYWTPSLIGPDGNPVAVRDLQVYYRNLPGTDHTPIRPFPPNFRLVAGGDGNLNWAGWGCTGTPNTTPYLAVPGDCGAERLRLHVIMPMCWDGHSHDSPDHRSHMGRPVGGLCPPSHPVKLPRLGLTVVYEISDGTGLLLSNDTQEPHADFWNTWNQVRLEEEVALCLGGGLDCGFLESNLSRHSGPHGKS